MCYKVFFSTNLIDDLFRLLYLPAIDYFNTFVIVNVFSFNKNIFSILNRNQHLGLQETAKPTGA